MKKVLSLITCVLVLFTVSVTVFAHPGAWRSFTQKDGLYDDSWKKVIKVTAIRVNTDSLFFEDYQYSKPTLYIYCQQPAFSNRGSRDTFMVIDWTNYISHDNDINVDIRFRVDKQASYMTHWSINKDRRAVTYDRTLATWLGSTNAATIQQIEGLMEGHKLVAQVNAFNGEYITAIFDIGGIKSAIMPIRESCDWDTPG